MDVGFGKQQLLITRACCSVFLPMGNRSQILAMCLFGKNGSGRLSLYLSLQSHLP